MFLFFAAAVADGILIHSSRSGHKGCPGIRSNSSVCCGLLRRRELLADAVRGRLADRFRPASGTAGFDFSGVGFGGFLLLFFIHGAIAARRALLASVFSRAAAPDASTVIADVVPSETRREHFALKRVMSNAGSMRGPRSARCWR